MVRILIVEDELPISDLLETALSKSGYHCTCAYDGLEAANIIEKESFDFVFLDCPAGLGEGFGSAIGSADRALVVATPDITSIRDASRAASVIAQSEKIPVHLVINRMRPAFVKKGYFENVDNIMDEIGLPLIGIVPEDEKVMVCAGCRRSLFKEKKAVSADALNRISRRLCGENVALSPIWRR